MMILLRLRGKDKSTTEVGSRFSGVLGRIQSGTQTSGQQQHNRQTNSHTATQQGQSVKRHTKNILNNFFWNTEYTVPSGAHDTSAPWEICPSKQVEENCSSCAHTKNNVNTKPIPFVSWNFIFSDLWGRSPVASCLVPPDKQRVHTALPPVLPQLHLSRVVSLFASQSLVFFWLHTAAYIQSVFGVSPPSPHHHVIRNEELAGVLRGHRSRPSRCMAHQDHRRIQQGAKL